MLTQCGYTTTPTAVERYLLSLLSRTNIYRTVISNIHHHRHHHLQHLEQTQAVESSQLMWLQLVAVVVVASLEMWFEGVLTAIMQWILILNQRHALIGSPSR